MDNDEASTLARAILALRQKRDEHLPGELFADHAWHILLAMFIADADGERMSAAAIFERAGTPKSVGRRWFAVLKGFGLAFSHGPCDGSNIVALTPQGIQAIEACMDDAQSLVVTRPSSLAEQAGGRR